MSILAESDKCFICKQEHAMKECPFFQEVLTYNKDQPTYPIIVDLGIQKVTRPLFGRFWRVSSLRRIEAHVFNDKVEIKDFPSKSDIPINAIRPFQT